MTGGKYFRATSAKALEKIYQDIDRLEKTKIETTMLVTGIRHLLTAISFSNHDH